MHAIKTINVTNTKSGTALPTIAILALSVLPLLVLQLSMTATLQIVALLSLAMVVLAHVSVSEQKNFDAAHLAIKLVSPVQFAFVIWLSVTFGRELGGASFASSYMTSIACLFGILIVDALASAAALLVAGRTGVSVATLISAKYAGLLGEVK